MTDSTTPAAPRNTEEQLVRLMFPLLRRKDGKPRKRQPPMKVSMNGRCLWIARGCAVDAPVWVPQLCDSAASRYGDQVRGGVTGADYYECFTSKRKPNKEVRRGHE